MFGLSDSNQHDDSRPASGPDEPVMDGSKDEPAGPANQPAPPLGLDEPPMPVSEPKQPADDNQLISLKEQALSSLSPLVNHLEQTPEERFKTVMMLIQATDNSGLIKEAYAAANQIPDEKARAQALLDVINEINYFTQKDKKPETKDV